MLDICGLHAFYGDSHVLQGVSLTIGEGELVTLIGRNGAGKTTLLKCIIGDIDHREGKIDLNGHNLIALPPDKIARLGVGYVPEDRGIFGTLSVLENLTFPPVVGEKGWSLDRMFAVFPALKERANQKASKLSGGEQQMLAIARVLRMGAPFILLDEPTEGLAPVIVEAIGDVLRELKASGLTILLVEQNLRFAAAVADRHNLMANGKIVRTLSNEEIVANEKELLDELCV
jgi:branched-chain amino acid transport system ATP-binding protein